MFPTSLAGPREINKKRMGAFRAVARSAAPVEKPEGQGRGFAAGLSARQRSPLRSGAQQRLLARPRPLPWGSLNPALGRPQPGDLSLGAAPSPGSPDEAGFPLFMLQTSSAGTGRRELLAASQGKAPRLHVVACGDTRSAVSLFAQVALAQVAWPVLVPLGASSAYNVLPRPLACSPVMSPWSL